MGFAAADFLSVRFADWVSRPLHTDCAWLAANRAVWVFSWHIIHRVPGKKYRWTVLLCIEYRAKRAVWVFPCTSSAGQKVPLNCSVVFRVPDKKRTVDCWIDLLLIQCRTKMFCWFVLLRIEYRTKRTYCWVVPSSGQNVLLSCSVVPSSGQNVLLSCSVAYQVPDKMYCWVVLLFRLPDKTYCWVVPSFGQNVLFSCSVAYQVPDKTYCWVPSFGQNALFSSVAYQVPDKTYCWVVLLHIKYRTKRTVELFCCISSTGQSVLLSCSEFRTKRVVALFCCISSAGQNLLLILFCLNNGLSMTHFLNRSAFYNQTWCACASLPDGLWGEKFGLFYSRSRPQWDSNPKKRKEAILPGIVWSAETAEFLSQIWCVGGRLPTTCEEFGLLGAVLWL